MPKRKLSESFDALQAPLCNGRLALNVEALSKSSLPLLPRPSPLSAEQFARAFERGCEIGNGTEQGAHEDMGAMGAMGATPFVLHCNADCCNVIGPLERNAEDKEDHNGNAEYSVAFSVSGIYSLYGL